MENLIVNIGKNNVKTQKVTVTCLEDGTSLSKNATARLFSYYYETHFKNRM